MKFAVIVLSSVFGLNLAHASSELQGFNCSVQKAGAVVATANFALGSTPTLLKLENGDQIEISASLVRVRTDSLGVLHTVVELIQDQYDFSGNRVGHGKIVGEFHEGNPTHFKNAIAEVTCFPEY